MTKTVSNFDRLVMEKHRLQTFCTYQEKLITFKFDHIKKNFPEIITQEILPYKPDKNREISAVLDLVNDFILRLLPPRYRESRFVAGLLKVMQGLVIRGFSKKVMGDR